MKRLKIFTSIIICFLLLSSSGKKQKIITVKPSEYLNALRNPLMGFTTRGIYNHPWATTAQTYIPWNIIENQESDGIEKIKHVCDSYAKAFKNKKVSVREVWNNFTQHPFGEYWDSWAHYSQMWPHGNNINALNKNGRYKETFIGGEVGYNPKRFGQNLQPGLDPTECLSKPLHCDFVINTIRWLHCTQLRWIEDYDQQNPEAVKGAEKIQKVFGYRYVLNEVRFSLNRALNVEFDVTNTGSAPFYYNWPVEVALLDPGTKKPVWKSTFDTDIRKWLPGEGWTEPDWTAISEWSKFLPDVNWNKTGNCKWEIPPKKITVRGNFKVDVPKGSYVLSLAILDPAGNMPSLRFATANYLNGGRHPVGMVDIKKNQCYPLAFDFPFDDPAADKSLFYKN